MHMRNQTQVKHVSVVTVKNKASGDKVARKDSALKNEEGGKGTITEQQR